MVKKKAEKSREARSESRRWQNVLSSMGEDCGDLLKFNQLKVCGGWRVGLCQIVFVTLCLSVLGPCEIGFVFVS